ncbi:PPE-repeat protein [Saccharothrix saharensis]|uniref:PPE-repeat protein n=1 Tax=Saccharothrix saharensis TaxID=571190 RepID=A0A543JM14_9PSEU|nr:hypothetical protein [Saccharothrix saharensis]TQM83804.1 PPE-repeat protein [Saccharothrix saharensis]
MAGENPLVVTPDAEPGGAFNAGTGDNGWATGISIAESAMDTFNGIKDGNWVEAGLGMVGLAADAAAMAIDPFGTLMSSAASFLMEHVQPLKDMLDWLAGDPPVIESYSATWGKVAEELGRIAEEYSSGVQRGTEGWTGAAAQTYLENSKVHGDALAGAASAAGTVGTVVGLMGMVVAFVREMVRDLIADLVGKLIAWVLEAVFSLGFGTPVIVAQAVTAISKWAAKIAKIIQDLLNTIKKVSPMLKRLVEVFEKIMKVVGKLAGKATGLDVLDPGNIKKGGFLQTGRADIDTPSGSPDTSPSGTGRDTGTGDPSTSDTGTPPSNRPTDTTSTSSTTTADPTSTASRPGRGDPTDVPPPTSRPTRDPNTPDHDLPRGTTAPGGNTPGTTPGNTPGGNTPLGEHRVGPGGNAPVGEHRGGGPGGQPASGGHGTPSSAGTHSGGTGSSGGTGGSHSSGGNPGGGGAPSPTGSPQRTDQTSAATAAAPEAPPRPDQPHTGAPNAGNPNTATPQSAQPGPGGTGGAPSGGTPGGGAPGGGGPRPGSGGGWTGTPGSRGDVGSGLPTSRGPENLSPSSRGPSGTGPTHASPSHGGPTHGGPTHTGPTHSGPTHSGPSHAGPAHGGPSHGGPSHASPSGTSPSHAGPSHAGPGSPHNAPNHAPTAPHTGPGTPPSGPPHTGPGNPGPAHGRPAGGPTPSSAGPPHPNASHSGPPHTGPANPYTPHSPNGPSQHTPHNGPPNRGSANAPHQRDGSPDFTRPRGGDGPGPHAPNRPDGPPPPRHPDAHTPTPRRDLDGQLPPRRDPDGIPTQRRDPDAWTPPHRDTDAPKPHSPDGDTPHRDTDRPDSDRTDTDRSDADRPDIDQAHARHGETTPAGISHHRGDSDMGDLPHRVPPDPRYFTADVHITPDGRARIGNHTYTPEDYGDLLRRNGWDGRTPLRLIGCDAGSNDFANRLARHTGADVLAPTKPAWTDTHGRVYTSDAHTGPDGTRQPRIPPNGEWNTHHPDGTTTKTGTDGFAPGTDDTDKTDLDPTDAQDRGEDPDRTDDKDGDEDPPVDTSSPEYQRQREQDFEDLVERNRELREEGARNVGEMNGGTDPDLDIERRPNERALTTMRFRPDDGTDPSDLHGYSGKSHDWPPADETAERPPKNRRLFEDKDAGPYDPDSPTGRSENTSPRTNDSEVKLLEEITRQRFEALSGLTRHDVDVAIQRACKDVANDVKFGRKEYPDHLEGEVERVRDRVEKTIENLNKIGQRNADRNGTEYTPFTVEDIKGDLRLAVDLPSGRNDPVETQICQSCQDAITQFEAVFPGVRVEARNLAQEILI